MKKKELSYAISNHLREIGAKKAVSIPKARFYITDEQGVTKSFYVERENKYVPFSSEDVDLILDAVFDTITQTLAKGEKVAIQGFGIFELKTISERTLTDFRTYERTVVVPAHCYPRFTPKKDLKDAAATYNASVLGVHKTSDKYEHVHYQGNEEL